MKIIQIGNYPEDSSSIGGGIEASIFGITQALAKENQVQVISFPKKNIKKDIAASTGNIQINYLCNPYKFNCMGFLRLNKFRQLIKTFKPRIVHIHESAPLCFFVLLYLRLKKIDSAITIHGIFHIETWKNFKRLKNSSNFLKFILYSFFEYLIILAGKKIIVDTQYVADSLSKIKKRQYYVVPQGINSRYFELQDKYETNNILSIGAISHRKGYEYSILAIDRLKKEFPTIRYQIIGSVTEEHQAYFSYLLELIKEKELENNVTITPNLPSDRLTQILEKCNIFALHSFEESQGIAICEAMAAGKPIVATKIGGIPCVVEDGVNGKLSSFGDIELFAENIRNIFLDSKLRHDMGVESRKKSHRYAWDRISSEILEIYNL
jgi:glycosyltransferase involved in cell wall biosynthesis